MTFGNMPVSYHVEVPSGAEPVYGAAGPVFLSLAVLLGGWWLLRVRRTPGSPARAVAWAALGCTSIGYTAGWIWLNRGDVVLLPRIFDHVAVLMPWLWGLASVLIMFHDWRLVWQRRAEERFDETVLKHLKPKTGDAPTT